MALSRMDKLVQKLMSNPAYKGLLEHKQNSWLIFDDTASLKISPFQSQELMKVIYTQIYVNRWGTLAMA